MDSPNPNILRTVRLKVQGFVQGVGYRYFCLREAQRLGLNGWVSNMPDGAVCAQATGTEEELCAFIEALERGPRLAQVSAVDIDWLDEPHELPEFTIR